jgi:putative endopeptidase
LRSTFHDSLFGLSHADLGQISSPESGADLKAIDKTADPCQNFYQYACGSWIKANPVPPNTPVGGASMNFRIEIRQFLRPILEDSSQHQDESPIDQKIGAYYGGVHE